MMPIVTSATGGDCRDAYAREDGRQGQRELDPPQQARPAVAHPAAASTTSGGHSLQPHDRVADQHQQRVQDEPEQHGALEGEPGERGEHGEQRQRGDRVDDTAVARMGLR
jgi:hypothetical protein